MQESFCSQCQVTFSGESVPLCCPTCQTELTRKGEENRPADTSSATLIIGMLLLIGGIIAYFVASPKIQSFQTGFGQLATAFSQDAASQLQRWQFAYWCSIGAIVLGALCLVSAFYDAIRAGQRK